MPSVRTAQRNAIRSDDGPHKARLCGDGTRGRDVQMRERLTAPQSRALWGLKWSIPLPFPSSAPVCALGHLPPGEGLFGRARRPAPTDRARLGSRAPQTGHRPTGQARRGRRAPRKGLAPPRGAPPQSRPQTPQESAPSTNLPARRTTRRRRDRTTAFLCSSSGGRNGRGRSCHRA